MLGKMILSICLKAQYLTSCHQFPLLLKAPSNACAMPVAPVLTTPKDGKGGPQERRELPVSPTVTPTYPSVG